MTKTLLRLNTSIRGAESLSHKLADQIQDRLSAETIAVRDLTQGLPLIDGTWLGAAFTPAEDRTEDQKTQIALSEALIAEVQAADTLLITLPIYNFGLPAALKAWFDMVARAGVTFQYTENGPVGLLEGKRAVVAVASNGTQVGSELDFATPYLTHLLKFIGITDVQYVRSDMNAYDAEGSAKRAQDDLEKLVA
ncbi:MAG: NAD(P)H-dependent oxidoreductase [Pelagimonas sp.]|jgi:FMN-dependent NADH-azoreductase|nr:NAD(P)H-dependent oxidoreductase [Pelagimonas sp.]